MLNDPSTTSFIQAEQGGNDKAIQAMNITNKDCIKEFYMFIHGPFATNIYLDIMAEVDGKVLNIYEEKILDFIKGGTKADKKIAKNIGRDVSDLYGLIADLVKEDMLTNASVVDDAIRFVSGKLKDKDREQVRSSASTSSDSSGNEDNNKESKEPDYDDDEKSGKEGEEKQEQETGEITINQVF